MSSSLLHWSLNIMFYFGIFGLFICNKLLGVIMRAFHNKLTDGQWCQVLEDKQATMYMKTSPKVA